MLLPEMFESVPLRFVRCLRSHNSMGKPNLIIFADGSSKGYGVEAYVRWVLSHGSFTKH